MNSYFTQIPNDVLEGLLTRNFHKRHLNIMLLVSRLTHGCHRESCHLKASDFLSCGLQPPNVQQAIQELVNAHILFLERFPVMGIGKGHRKFFTICINPDVSQWGIPESPSAQSAFQETLHRSLPKPSQNNNLIETIMLQEKSPQQEVLQSDSKPSQNNNLIETITLSNRLPYQNNNIDLIETIRLSDDNVLSNNQLQTPKESIKEKEHVCAVEFDSACAKNDEEIQGQEQTSFMTCLPESAQGWYQEALTRLKTIAPDSTLGGFVSIPIGRSWSEEECLIRAKAVFLTVRFIERRMLAIQYVADQNGMRLRLKLPRDLARWCQAMRGMLVADDRDPHQIDAILAWLFPDDPKAYDSWGDPDAAFWRDPIQSVPNFREHYEQLALKAVKRQDRRMIYERV